MQLDDILNLALVLTYVITVLVFAIGAFRAIEIGRAFVSKLHRSRAFWTASVMIILLLGVLFEFFPVLSNLGIQNISIGELIFVSSLIVTFMFIDRNILITREADFFHRNTLHWAEFRRIAFTVLLASSAVLLLTSAFVNLNVSNLSISIFILAYSYFGFAGAVLGYAAITLVVGARRTPHRPMQNFFRLVGAALAMGVISFTIWIPLSFITSTVIENLVSGLFELGTAYFLYLSAVSLSPLGKVEKVLA